MDEINNLTSLKKFDNFLKVLSYYHVELCEHTDCSQCLFATNLRYQYVQNTVQGCDSVVNLQSYCRSKLDQFNCCRVFIKSLVHIEKQRIVLEKEFHRTLTLWNKPLTRPPTPPSETNTQT